MAKERWKAVRGYEGLYCISDWGRVWTVERKVYTKEGICCGGTGGYLMTRFSKNDKWYFVVHLRKNNKSKEHPIHRLIWGAFVGEIPKHLEINHKDGNKRNNDLSNLELVTHSQNIKHAYDIGLIPSRVGEGNTKAILTEQDVLWIRKLYDQVKNVLPNGKIVLPKGFAKNLAVKYKVTATNIQYVFARKSWKHLK